MDLTDITFVAFNFEMIICFSTHNSLSDNIKN